MESNSNLEISLRQILHKHKKMPPSHQFLDKMKVFNTDLIIIAPEGNFTARQITISQGKFRKDNQSEWAPNNKTVPNATHFHRGNTLSTEGHKKEQS